MRNLFLVLVFSLGIGFGTTIYDLALDLSYKDFKIDLQKEGTIIFYRDGKEVLQVYSDEIKTQVIDDNCTFLKRLNKDTIRLSCNVEMDISIAEELEEGIISIGPSNIIDCKKDDCSGILFNLDNTDPMTLEWPSKIKGL